MSKYLSFSVMFVLIFFLTACAETITQSGGAKNLTTAAQINAQLGLDYLQMGQHERALRKLSIALQQAPNLAIVQMSLGYYWMQLGDMKKAKGYYQKALTLAPHSGVIQNNVGVYLCKKGHYHEAVSHFIKATQDPHYIHAAQAFHNAGECALKIPAKKLAYEYFKKALQYHSKF